MADGPIRFGSFRLDADPDRLWRGSEEIHLRPKSLSMLAYLARRPGHLVAKDELREQIWATTHVSDNTLRVTLSEVRAALSDNGTTSRHVETVPGRGYRFVANPEASSGLESYEAQEAARLTAGDTERIVGRRREVEDLLNRFLEADKGRRQLVFLGGEAGAGKTTLVQLFEERLEGRPGTTLVVGQCPSFGEGEAYGLTAQATLVLVLEDQARSRPADGDPEDAVRWELELLAAADNGNPDNDSSDRAEACFRTALEVARRQQARSLELRAALSLSRLCSRSRSDGARKVLGDVLEAFTEGHDTTDLRAAREQMAQLARTG